MGEMGERNDERCESTPTRRPSRLPYSLTWIEISLFIGSYGEESIVVRPATIHPYYYQKRKESRHRDDDQNGEREAGESSGVSVLPRLANPSVPYSKLYN